MESVRFIPAWAGNTALVTAAIAPLAVHPRVGGEHSISDCSIEVEGGSSPRGRGTLMFGGQPFRAFRFIPAWAGNTLLNFASELKGFHNFKEHTG